MIMSKSSGKDINVAEFIEERLAAVGKTQRQVADEVGFDHPNVLSMIKQGKMKAPLNRIGPLARALEVDPRFLLRFAFSEYLPDTLDAVEDVFGAPLLTHHEIDLIRGLRLHFKGHDPQYVIKQFDVAGRREIRLRDASDDAHTVTGGEEG